MVSLSLVHPLASAVLVSLHYSCWGGTSSYVRLWLEYSKTPKDTLMSIICSSLFSLAACASFCQVWGTCGCGTLAFISPHQHSQGSEIQSVVVQHLEGHNFPIPAFCKVPFPQKFPDTQLPLMCSWFYCHCDTHPCCASWYMWIVFHWWSCVIH